MCAHPWGLLTVGSPGVEAVGCPSSWDQIPISCIYQGVCLAARCQELRRAEKGVLSWGLNIQHVNIHWISCFPTFKSPLSPGQKPSVLPFLKNKPLIFCPLGEGRHLAPEEWIREANCSLFSAHLLLEVPEPWEGSQSKSSCLYRPIGV